MHKARLLPPFALQLRPSRIFLLLVLCVLALSAVLLMLYQPRMWALLPCQFLLGWLALRANGWGNPNRVRRIEVDAHGRMQCLQGDRTVEVQLRDDCFVSPLFVIVNVTAAGRRHSCLLLPDSADQEALRQLRVYLLWFHPEAERLTPAVLENP
ncbi:protein YgfX [Aquitalea pelogenes]|uniref:protein YgfX n=1 Tax=Aquitalea pelogenes TaxID=1293573 RepID=UPI00078730E6|nr:protein YgfX [Aquitalea pelogenes]